MGGIPAHAANDILRQGAWHLLWRLCRDSIMNKALSREKAVSGTFPELSASPRRPFLFFPAAGTGLQA